MLQLILVRHGETVGNKENYFYGRLNYPLTKKGINQAELVSNKLKGLAITRFYSSTLGRCIQTAEIIKKHHSGTEHIISSEIDEMNFGDWEGKKTDIIKKNYKVNWEEWNKDWWNSRINGGETAHEVYLRVSTFLDKVLNSYNDGNIVVVGHLSCIKFTIIKLLNLKNDFFHKIRIEPGKITTICIEYGNSVLTKLND